MQLHSRLAAACCAALVAGCGSGLASQTQEQTAPAPASTDSSVEDATAAAAGPVEYRLTGTEPFWAGELRADSFRYSTPLDIDGTIIPGRRADLPDGRVRFTGTDEGRDFALTLTPASCNNGMSDQIYSFEAVLTIDGEQRRGCAGPADSPAFD
ncbi:COG3650 family protein [Altericroceibacterium xinjiangense]|uniref:COG3650 family protein n=1 Tax=Altericroceibacterium xinjiangense TaxID=762261 RepID=UPI000F7F0EDD|nr:hypothetical protein [Altericroceibacterium xinjiangense]